MIKYFCPILVTLAFAQVSSGIDQSVLVRQKEGSCKLRDFGLRPDGWLQGIGMWFGADLVLKTSWYVASESWNHNQNCIYAGGMVLSSRHADLYYCYNVAFFDTEENLIACNSDIAAWAPGPGGAECALGPVKDATESSVTCIMPIPKGLCQNVNSYKVAYYESNVAIGKAVWDEHKMLRAESRNGNTGKTTVRSLPCWKSDGELRGSPFQVRAGSRLLPIDAKENWQAETTEGTCSLIKTAASNTGEAQYQKFSIAVGNALKLKADCRFKINQDNAIETWVSFKNASDKKRFGTLYIAFFDRYGNLVGSTHADTALEPNGTMPRVTQDGQPQSDAYAHAYQTIMPMPIPLGFDKNITSYKITLYESDRPIGENKAEGR